MTIRNDWCQTCEEASDYNAVICSVCGDSLTSRPAPAVRVVRSSTPSTIARASLLLPEHIVQQVHASNDELTVLLAELRQQVSDLRDHTFVAQQRAASVFGDIEDLRGILPPEAFDPQQARAPSRGTAKETLNALPRITVEKKSSILAQATVSVSSGGPQFEAVLGEFGPPAPHVFKNKKLVVASPRTGKGGLSQDTVSKANESILYMERGGELTFVRKAIMAQEVGAIAVIIGNNTSASWPYSMKDSNGEASLLSLRIPVVMIKETDGQLLVQRYQTNASTTCNLEVNSISKECIICCEEFSLGQNLLQLPACGHFFHERCALTWLTEHNSCPFCRRQLPTDDPIYEAERRRTQRTHAGGSGGTTDSNGDSFYG